QRIDSLRKKLLVLGIEILLRDEVQITTEANALKEKGDFKGAQERYDEAIRINPNLEIAWANKGLAFFQIKDYENALRCFEKWTEIRPRLGLAWDQKGRALINLKDFGRAAESLQKAVDFAPEVWSAWDNLGRALLNLGKYEEAAASFDTAIAYYNRACFRSKAGKRDEAVDDLRRAIELEPVYASQSLAEPDLQSLLADPIIKALVGNRN